MYYNTMLLLEEELQSSTHPPADIALSLLSYLRYELPNGGAEAEYRFCLRLYPLIMSRIFGSLLLENAEVDVGGVADTSVVGETGIVSPSSSSGSSSSGAALLVGGGGVVGIGKKIRHEPGGWFSRQSQWKTITSSQYYQQEDGSGGAIPRGRGAAMAVAGAVVAMVEAAMNIPARMIETVTSSIEGTTFVVGEGGGGMFVSVPSPSVQSSASSSCYSSNVLRSDPVVQLLSVSSSSSTTTEGFRRGQQQERHQQRHGTSAIHHQIRHSSLRQSGGGGRQHELQFGQQHYHGPTLIDVISLETKHHPAIHLSFPLFALPIVGQNALIDMAQSAMLMTAGVRNRNTTGVGMVGRRELFYHDGTVGSIQSSSSGRRTTENCRVLYESLLHVDPMEQRAVARFIELSTDKAKQQQMQQSQQQRELHQQQSRQRQAGIGEMHMRQYSPRQQRQRSDASSSSIAFAMGGQQSQQLGVGGAGVGGPQMRKTLVAEAMVLLTMWEYFFFVFVRYPFARPLVETTTSTSTSTSTRATTPMTTSAPSLRKEQAQQQRGRHSSASGGTSRRRLEEPYGEAVYCHLFQVYVRHYLCHLQPMLTRNSELFLRIVIQFWIENENIPMTNAQCEDLSRRREEFQRQQEDGVRAATTGAAAAAGGGVSTLLNLSDAYDYARLVGPYRPTPQPVLKGLLYLIRHVCSDPALEESMLRCRIMAMKSPIVQNVSPTAAASSVGATGGRSDGSLWCLTPQMTLLQQPIWNYIRLAFRYAPIHQPDSPFFAALNIWLTWIEPWNWVRRKTNRSFAWSAIGDRLLQYITGIVVGGGQRGESSASRRGQTVAVATGSSSVQRKSSSSSRKSSKYTSEWEPFIYANVHMYTIPLAIFLRRAIKHFDFSPKHFQHSMLMVQRVFRVFSPNVVRAINLAMEGVGRGRRGGGRSRTANDSDDSLKEYMSSSLRLQHERVLREFCPSPWMMAMSTGSTTTPVDDEEPQQEQEQEQEQEYTILSGLKTDILTLLEEMYFQYYKKVREMDWFDRVDDGLNNLSGRWSTNAEEKCLHCLREGAFAMLGLPLDYEVLPSSFPILSSCKSLSLSSGRLLQGAIIGDRRFGETSRGGGDSTTTTRPRTTRGGIITDNANARDAKSRHTSPDRTGSMLLSEKGKDEIIRGRCVLHPSDVHYIGDPMNARVRSYEVAFLVYWCVRLSRWMNEYLGLVVPSTDTDNASFVVPSDMLLRRALLEGEASHKIRFRINLRFLADKRNILFIACLLLCVWLIRCIM